MIGTAESLKTYALAIGEGGRILGEVVPHYSAHDAGIELDQKAQSYSVRFGVDYVTAFHSVLGAPENVELKMSYGGTEQAPEFDQHVSGSEKAGMEVDRLTRRYAVDLGIDYCEAMKRVLADPANSELKEEYGS
jgi:hypothetical protein